MLLSLLKYGLCTVVLSRAGLIFLVCVLEVTSVWGAGRPPPAPTLMECGADSLLPVLLEISGLAHFPDTQFSCLKCISSFLLEN